ncbi:hypothetical protein AVEN_218085-1 [Araneus ventricosus]|uniref:Uncharacterized protein n=1 Tax=Araneus ventricosus TaxID=182803 RepID=A0A4Y2QSI0_ARAVE|nr:hypothetical protein AVEN_218085-1 [Araneus ventricosus]
MSQRMALVPSDILANYYTSQKKPEIRLEADIVDLLNRDQQLPDDMKVKLLGQLITRYQKTVHQPPEPIRVSISDDKPANIEERNAIANHVTEPIMNDILASVPSTFAKFVPAIVEKLKIRNYSWNELGELTYNNTPFRGSKIVDLFSYLMRNISKKQPPTHFDEFLHALQEINIPTSWIANQLVLSRIQTTSRQEENDLSNSAGSVRKLKHRRKSKKSKSILSSEEEKSPEWRRSESRKPTKWHQF